MIHVIALVLASTWLTLGWGTAGRVGDEWREIRYKGRTRYSVMTDSAGVFLRAEARDKNSAMFHPLPAGSQLNRLRWKWRVLRHPEGADPTRRARDDRAASVLVLVHRSFLPWRTRGLLYQWSPAGTPGTWSPSPYARGIHVLTLRQEPASGNWFEEERDVRQDLLDAFGEVPKSIEAVGILCDADNTGDWAVAEFGELQYDLD